MAGSMVRVNIPMLTELSTRESSIKENFMEKEH
jgi:hypothetical protein